MNPHYWLILIICVTHGAVFLTLDFANGWPKWTNALLLQYLLYSNKPKHANYISCHEEELTRHALYVNHKAINELCIVHVRTLSLLMCSHKSPSPSVSNVWIHFQCSACSQIDIDQSRSIHRHGGSGQRVGGLETCSIYCTFTQKQPKLCSYTVFLKQWYMKCFVFVCLLTQKRLHSCFWFLSGLSLLLCFVKVKYALFIMLAVLLITFLPFYRVSFITVKLFRHNLFCSV